MVMEGCGCNWGFCLSTFLIVWNVGQWLWKDVAVTEDFSFLTVWKVGEWLQKDVATIEDSPFLGYHAVSMVIWLPAFWRNVLLLQCQELTAQRLPNNTNIGHNSATIKCSWLLFPNRFLMPVTSVAYQRPKDGTYHKSTWNISWTALRTSEANGTTLTLTMHQWVSGRTLCQL